MPFTQADIGPRYDFGLATRDGSYLACLDQNGKPQDLNQVAFMTSMDKQKTQDESTELQEKQSLIQFASATLIDREFDQWPQVTQGDWSGGIGQRIYNSNVPTNQFYDGGGLIWPYNDWVPQAPFAGPIDGLPPNFGAWSINGTAGGYIDGLGQGFATVYTDNTGAPGAWHARFQAGDNVYDFTFFGANNNYQGPMHMHIAGGYLWIIFSTFPQTTNFQVIMLGCAYGANTFTLLRDDIVPIPGGGGGSEGYSGLVSASLVAGKLYVAVLLTDVNPGFVGAPPTANRNNLWVLDYSLGTGSVPAGLGAPLVVFPFERGFKPIDLNWQGSTIVVSASDNFNSYIYTIAPTAATVTTQVALAGTAQALLCSVGSTLVIVATTPGPTGINRMELYTLVGGTLTEIPFVSPLLNTGQPNISTFPIFDSVTSPVAFGSYAFWAVSLTLPGTTQKAIEVYAYDVSRGRLFRAFSVTDPNWLGSDIFGHDEIAVYGVTSRTLLLTPTGHASFQAQFGIAVFSGLLATGGPGETAREFYWGVLPVNSPQAPVPATTGLVQMGCDLVSSQIDFTAASNKLYKQIVVTFVGGMQLESAATGVTLNAWLDKDQTNLNIPPDFTGTTPPPKAVPPIIGQLAIPINQVARKLVYEAISFGPGLIQGIGSAVWQNCPKLVSVAVQVATGWVWDIVADISPNVQTNSKNSQEYVYSAQSSPSAGLQVDHVASYNFLRQLWRQKGGQCVLTLPNGDSYPALIQSLKFSSPKPVAASFRSDQRASVQVICTLKIREDI